MGREIEKNVGGGAETHPILGLGELQSAECQLLRVSY